MTSSSIRIMYALTFRVMLPEGPIDLWAWLIDQDGTSRSAYFVNIEPVEELPKLPRGKRPADFPKETWKLPPGGRDIP